MGRQLIPTAHQDRAYKSSRGNRVKFMKFDDIDECVRLCLMN